MPSPTKCLAKLQSVVLGPRGNRAVGSEVIRLDRDPALPGNALEQLHERLRDWMARYDTENMLRQSERPGGRRIDRKVLEAAVEQLLPNHYLMVGKRLRDAKRTKRYEQ